ncbi:DUF4043 family protein [Microbulbifer sp. TYP-18]|uniref:phage capsid family protein n=1 Tax=Microbulbifer sp. TYP-18 TaxID=3230024 RepID=UPI0034C68EA2
MATHISANSPAGRRLFNVALFTEASRPNSFANMMTGKAPKTVSKNKADGNVQTNPGAPIVRITNLSKQAGDEVTMDLYHQLRMKPTMGDRKIAGRGGSLSSAQFNLKIDQGRLQVDSGGRMSQQRTSHDLRNVARTMLGPNYNALDDQLCLVHLAGARGDHDDAEWAVPLSSDPEFAEIAVNPVKPPTYDRHMYAGDALSLDGGSALDSADLFDLTAVDNLRLVIDEMPFPIQPVKFEGDPQANDNPFYVLSVSPRQWNDFWTSMSGSQWQTLLSNAHSRAKGFNHPLFIGEVAMWRNILIRKRSRTIRFSSGSNVTVCTNTANAQTTTATVGTNVERAILLGGQALATAFGRNGKKAEGGHHFRLHEELTDAGNMMEHTVYWTNGKAKVQFEGTDGRINDHGCMVLDTAVSG